MEYVTLKRTMRYVRRMRLNDLYYELTRDWSNLFYWKKRKMRQSSLVILIRLNDQDVIRCNLKAFRICNKLKLEQEKYAS